MIVPQPQIDLIDREALRDALPDQLGCYFWYFRDLQALFLPEMRNLLELERAIRHDDHFLLYIGIAEGQSIKERVLTKHLRSAHVSTLRHSVGSLLAHKEGIPVDPRMTTGKFAIAAEWQIETRVSGILERNAMLSWVTAEEPMATEDQLLRDSGISFPLNIRKNKHPFGATLKKLRSRYKRC